MALRVAVDFGTSSTCVVMSTQGREPQVIAVDGSPLLSSAVYAAADGTLFVGQEAERQAAVDPSRYEPHPKRRIDEGELLLGDTVLGVLDVVHAVLERAVREARRVAGGAAVDLLVLTHPADWGAVRTRLLRQAAGGLASEVALVPEPVAAAVYHAATFSPAQVNQERTVEFSGSVGDTLAVLDLGGGTVDVSVVRRAESSAAARARGGFRVLATRGDPTFGGSDVDQALLEHIGSTVAHSDSEAWSTLVQGRELSERRRRRVLRQDVRGAKETLSRHVYTDVPMPPPFVDAHITRVDLERLVAVPLSRTVELARAAIADSGLRGTQLAAIFLVGGSSRIPMVSRLVHERLGVVPTTLDQPETVVARGALRAVLVEPDRTGSLPGTGANAAPQAQDMASRTVVVGRDDVPRGPLPRPPRPTRAGSPAPRGYAAPPALALGRASASGSAGPAGPAGPARFAPTREPAPVRGHSRKWWWAGAATIVVAAVVAGSVALLGGDERTGQPAGSQRVERVDGRRFAQYHYSFVAPPGWVQTADNVAARQVVVKPDRARGGDDLVVVQERSLPYDGVEQWQRFVRELRADIDSAPDGRYVDFRPSARFGGKRVVSYTEVKTQATVVWYVLAGGKAEVLVGCQHAEMRIRVRSACERIVRTLEIRQ